MKFARLLGNESGFVMVVTTLALLGVTALGLTLAKLSSNETLMATNERCQEQARTHSASIAFSTIKLIRHVTERADEGVFGIDAGDPVAQGIQYPAGGGGGGSDSRAFYDKLVDVANIGAPGVICNDLELNPGVNIPGLMDLRDTSIGAVPLTRTLEFATGYTQGVGSGSIAGGMAMWFDLVSRGDGCDDARKIIYSRYRRNLDVAGGM